MLRGVRVAIVLATALALVGGCGDDGDEGGESLSREQGIDVLVAQGYTPEGASCLIDNAEDQDADVLEILNRDQVSQRELQVLATIQEFCLRTLGAGATVVPTTAPATVVPPTGGG